MRTKLWIVDSIQLVWVFTSWTKFSRIMLIYKKEKLGTFFVQRPLEDCYLMDDFEDEDMIKAITYLFGRVVEEGYLP